MKTFNVTLYNKTSIRNALGGDGGGVGGALLGGSVD